MMADADHNPPLTLWEVANNSVVWHTLSAYIGVKGLLFLAATNKSFRELVLSQPIYRVDLSSTSKTWDRQEREWWPSVQQADEKGTPMLVLGCLSSHDLAKSIRTLILDWQTVPFTFLSKLLIDLNYGIRLLSINGCRGIRYDALMRLLRYLIRVSRPEGMPKLKGLYCSTFLARTVSSVQDRGLTAPLPTGFDGGVTTSVGATLGVGMGRDGGANKKREDSFAQFKDIWYDRRGRILDDIVDTGWGDLLEACEGIIAFDATVCRHDRDLYGDPRPTIASIRLSGCDSCGSCPEGPAFPGRSVESHLPLVSPPPIQSYTVKAAQTLDLAPGQTSQPTFIARCPMCLKDRWCEDCNAWWCENCYVPASLNRRISESPTAQTKASLLSTDIKVHNGLCVANCLRRGLLVGGGEGGMWG